MSEFLDTVFSQSAQEPDYLLEPRLIWEVENGNRDKPCFRTDKSHNCTEACDLRRICCRPIAEWLRYR